ncbi:MAG: 3'-5' exoribonuclease [Prevotellaceae bacterium]|nr:3'-5' exoribonuclease [Prevotellaceae bacterium]
METKERLDIMLDLETLGTQAGSIILSVAMQTFSLDETKEPKEEFSDHLHISVLSSLFHHLMSDYDTEDWWMRQSPEARQKVLNGQRDAADVENVMHLLYPLFSRWNEKYDLYIWGRGVGFFDMPLLDAVMRTVIGDGYKTPWKYWAAMDVRTLMNFCKTCGLAYPKTETPHDAHEDVMKQIKEVQMCWQYVKVERAV